MAGRQTAPTPGKALRAGNWRTGRVLAVALLLSGTGPASAENELPTDFIAATAQQLAAEVAARNPGLKTDRVAQRALVDEVLRPRFDLAKSCELMLRTHWTAASPPMRQALVDSFSGFLIASYADALHWFRADTLTVLPDQPLPVGDRYRVRTLLRMYDGQTHQVQFYLRRNDGSWYFVDVIVDGVSYVRTWSSDFGALVRQEGLQSLIDWLDQSGAERR